MPALISYDIHRSLSTIHVQHSQRESNRQYPQWYSIDSTYRVQSSHLFRRLPSEVQCGISQIRSYDSLTSRMQHTNCRLPFVEIAQHPMRKPSLSRLSMT